MRKDKGEEFFSRGATVLPSHFPELPACHCCRSRRCVTCGVGIVGGALFGYEEACVQETDSLEGVIYEPGVFQFFFPEVTGGSVTIVVGCIYARLVGALVSGLCVCVRVCNCVFDAFFFCLYSFFFLCGSFSAFIICVDDRGLPLCLAKLQRTVVDSAIYRMRSSMHVRS